MKILLEQDYKFINKETGEVVTRLDQDGNLFINGNLFIKGKVHEEQEGE